VPPSDPDARYLELILKPIRVCAHYAPKFGQSRTGGLRAGLSLHEFQSLYRGDPFYSWFGLDNPLMYAAHKAAGGMTSVYRQIGIGSEKLVRTIIADSLSLSAADATWSYRVPFGKGKTRKLALDARIPMASVSSPTDRARVQQWMRTATRMLGVDSAIASSLKGVVMEIRQGYKSKDSKRQNADIANAATAYAQAYLPCALILSAQIDEDLLERYRREQWTILTGIVGKNDPYTSTYDFMREVVGYDLRQFFERHAETLRLELDSVLKTLLSA
jgi:hypothetical protein